MTGIVNDIERDNSNGTSAAIGRCGVTALDAEFDTNRHGKRKVHKMQRRASRGDVLKHRVCSIARASLVSRPRRLGGFVWARLPTAPGGRPPSTWSGERMALSDATLDQDEKFFGWEGMTGIGGLLRICALF